jgi:hypothetical protein
VKKKLFGNVKCNVNVDQQMTSNTLLKSVYVHGEQEIRVRIPPGYSLKKHWNDVVIIRYVNLHCLCDL